MKKFPKPHLRNEPDTRAIGYARVSTEEQDLRAQVAALREAGVLEENLYTDKASGKTMKRPGLEAALLDCRPGDVLIVPALDRLARSIEDLIYLTKRLQAEGVQLRSLRESFIDTTTPVGELLFHVLASLAQFERSLTGQRTREGLERAKERGATLGAKPKLTQKKLEKAARMLSHGMNSNEVARQIGVSGPQLRARIQAEYGRKLWTPRPRKN